MSVLVFPHLTHSERREADETGKPRFIEERESSTIVSPESSPLDRIESLISQKDWLSALQELAQIPESQRNQRYHRWTEEAALLQLKHHSDFPGTPIDSIAISLVNEFPKLAQSRRFLNERNRLSHNSLQLCYERLIDSSECDLRYKNLVETDQNELPLILTAIENVENHSCTKNAIGILGAALGPTNRYQLCNHTQVQDLLIRAMALPPGEASELALSLVNQQCRDAMISKIRNLNQDQIRPFGIFFRNNACNTLKGKKPTASPQTPPKPNWCNFR